MCIASIPWDDTIAIVPAVVLVIYCEVIKGSRESQQDYYTSALFVIFYITYDSIFNFGIYGRGKIYLQPKWHHLLLEVDTWVIALGQAHFWYRLMDVEWSYMEVT